MPAKTTKTLNPLPFQDLEPHRFEDLVRQLTYEFRAWKSLEATGRGGSDDGIDIRAVALEANINEELDDDDSEQSFTENLWIIQCKRHKTLTPKQVEKAVEDSLQSLENPPYGFILAVACDVSKKARDAFREEMVGRHIKEFQIWAKGELEDMMFQAKNDRLLFAYFGISLNPKRQSALTILRSRISKKKKLTSLFKEDDLLNNIVLLRDIKDNTYPYSEKDKTKDRKDPWIVCRVLSTKYPDCISVLAREHLAAVNIEKTQWDAILDFDYLRKSILNDPKFENVDNIRRFHDEPAWSFWHEYVPEDQKAYVKIRKRISFDRIIAIDDSGDLFYPIPHLFIDFDPKHGPFEEGARAWLESASMNRFRHSRLQVNPQDNNRFEYFPKKFPNSLNEAPPNFDQTQATNLELSPQINSSLKEVFSSFVAKKSEILKSRNDTNEEIPENHDRKAFKSWLEVTARPLLSKFVNLLREKGHEARFIERSAPSNVNAHEITFLESLEIRMVIDTGGSIHNPDYKPSGLIRATLTPHQGITLEAEPFKRDSNGHRRLSSQQVNLDDLTQEKLEELLLTVLQGFDEGYI